MDIFYWLCLLGMPVMISVIGFFMFKRPPEKINPFYGYRTIRSMKSTEAWIFAQKYSGKLWLIMGLPMLILSAAVFLYCKANFPDQLAMIFLIILTLQVVAIAAPIPIVEHALKENFDDQGKPKKDSR